VNSGMGSPAPHDPKPAMTGQSEGWAPTDVYIAVPIDGRLIL
jgi:hypothetical protein